MLFALLPGAGWDPWLWHLQLEPDEIDSGHSPMLARPAELAARLAAYADEL